LYRIVFKESRAKTYQFLSDVIDRSFELIILYQYSKKMSDKITCSHIIEDLHHAITGLKNIQHTYMDDRNFYCDIDTLIGSIYARLAEYYQQDNSIFTEEQRKRLHVILFPHEADEKEHPVAHPIAPVHSAPVHPAPVNPAPVNPAPVHSAPVHSAPVHSAPVNPIASNPVPEINQSTTHKTDTTIHDIGEIEHEKKKEKHKK
jgi:hypothetical protein